MNSPGVAFQVFALRADLTRGLRFFELLSLLIIDEIMTQLPQFLKLLLHWVPLFP
jgi:hypothetical protein